jgi:aminoglycoside phosphotransferase family enzyme/adenylate kinase family enzyme
MPQNRLFKALENPDRYTHDVDHVQRIETHISCVFLVGPLAYKLKKAVNFGFLDFSTLARRRHFCEEEIRLNSRLAPDLYRRVVAVTGTADQPRINGPGPVIEYAVEMNRFRQRDLYSALLANKQLSVSQLEQLAGGVARFHSAAAIADPASQYGRQDVVLRHMLDNFPAISWTPMSTANKDLLNDLEDWTRHRARQLAPVIEQRRLVGRVRECHGDMHLENIVTWQDQPTVFDGIDFEPELYWIDVISEIAFLTMDLEKRGAHSLARRFLNTYLESSGDYSGLNLMRFYLVYRALVRAKVCALTASSEGRLAAHASHDRQMARAHVELARRYSRPNHPQLVITFGLSGSGKSTAALKLVEQCGFIRLRSDVERKRLAGLAPLDRSHSALAVGLYSARFTELTYRRLLELAQTVLIAGYPAIVDATFLQARQRQAFQKLAAGLQVPYRILEMRASPDTLRERVRKRSGDPSEAGLAVLESQLARHAALTPGEHDYALPINAENGNQHWLAKEHFAA